MEKEAWSHRNPEIPTQPKSNLANARSELWAQITAKILECFGYTTAHGYARLAAAVEGSWARRWFWFIVCCGAFAAFTVQLYFITKQFMSRPLKTRIRINHNEEISFPQITVCNLNMIRKSQIPRHVLKEFPEVLGRASSGPTQMNTTTSKKSVKGKAGKAVPDIDDLPEKAQLIVKVLHKLSEIPEESLMSYGHQLEDMIMTCSYNDLECLDGDMRPFWTWFWHRRYGNCYTFNKGTDINGSDTEIMTISQPGVGLTLEMNIEQHEYVSELSQEAGIRVFIGGQHEMPFPYEQGISIAPGYATAIQLRKVIIGRLDPFENKSCETGDDRLNDSMFVRFNVNYTTMACRISCLAALMNRTCGCVWFTLKYNDWPVCDPAVKSVVNCVNDVFDKFDDGSCRKKCKEKCWQDTFERSVSLAKWPSRQYKKSLEADIAAHTRGNNTEDLSDHFLKLKVYFGELNYEVIEEENAYTPYSFWSDVGGLMGMWIGVSVLTIVELLELTATLIYTLFKSITRKNSPVVEVN